MIKMNDNKKMEDLLNYINAHILTNDEEITTSIDDLRMLAYGLDYTINHRDKQEEKKIKKQIIRVYDKIRTDVDTFNAKVNDAGYAGWQVDKLDYVKNGGNFYPCFIAYLSKVGDK
jgi:hypothetical protein